MEDRNIVLIGLAALFSGMLATTSLAAGGTAAAWGTGSLDGVLSGDLVVADGGFMEIDPVTSEAMIVEAIEHGVKVKPINPGKGKKNAGKGKGGKGKGKAGKGKGGKGKGKAGKGGKGKAGKGKGGKGKAGKGKGGKGKGGKAQRVIL